MGFLMMLIAVARRMVSERVVKQSRRGRLAERAL